MRVFGICIVAAFMVSACESPDVASISDVAHTAQGGIEISHARVRPPLPGRDVAVGYLTLTNTGRADRLVSVSSPIAERVELHNHIDDEGVLRMRRIEGVDLPAGATHHFSPGGYHLMMFNVTLVPDQTDVALTLTYETSDPVTIIADIEALGAAKTDEDTHHGSGH